MSFIMLSYETLLVKKVVVLNEYIPKICFSIGERAWNHVFTLPMEYLYFYKGKIYTLHTYGSFNHKTKFIDMMNLNTKESILTLLEIENFPSLTHASLVFFG